MWSKRKVRLVLKQEVNEERNKEHVVLAVRRHQRASLKFGKIKPGVKFSILITTLALAGT